MTFYYHAAQTWAEMESASDVEYRDRHSVFLVVGDSRGDGLGDSVDAAAKEIIGVASLLLANCFQNSKGGLTMVRRKKITRKQKEQKKGKGKPEKEKSKR